MTDRSDAVIVRYRPTHGPARQLVFEPRSDGRFRLVEREWTGCVWRPVGSRLVDDVALEPGGEIVV